MAGKPHNFLVSFISGKLKKNGFNIIYLDGNYIDISMSKFEIPPRIINHRPDLIAQNDEGTFYIGEAKTKSDLGNRRTQNQFIDFLTYVKINTNNRLIIGIYDDSQQELRKLLVRLNMLNEPQINIYCLPSLIKPKENVEEV